MIDPDDGEYKEMLKNAMGKTREREYRIESDTSPVPVSTDVDNRTGQPLVNQANKIPKTHKKEPMKEQSESLCSEIPEWLQEFRENLVDDEIPEHGDTTPVLLIKHL